MEATQRYRDLSSGGLPSILNKDGPFRSRGPVSFSSSNGHSRFSPTEAMGIPGASTQEYVPPPLPPPPFVPLDGPVPEYHHPVSAYPSTSSFVPSWDDRPNYKRRESGGTIRGDHDEGYASLSSASVSSTRSRESLPSLSAQFGLHHNRFQFRSTADSYSESLKRKLDPIKTFDNKSPPGRSLLSASATEFPRHAVQDSRGSPLSLPTTTLAFHPRGSLLDSPDRYTQTPLYSAVSPRSAPFQPLVANGHDGSDRSPPHRPRRAGSDDAATSSTQGSYDATGADEMDIDEPYQAAGIGHKRRALSPPHLARGSPTPRLTTSVPQGSISSISTARSGSYASTGFSVASSATSVGSFGRRSPGGLSPGGMSPIASETCGSPYATTMSITASSPRTTMPRPPHQRNVSDNRPMVSPRKLEVTKAGVARVQGFFMCECCPKKPKKFETAAELSAHEAEKQYECTYCGNRFKNKNEAERHQNSLHVRRHSWSCSAIQGYDRVFHESPSQPGIADTCGYCGEEFSRNGFGPGASAPRHATEADWDERIRHLQEVHKFRECNASKKFYRADHFRQHLKHSHAGTAGKWTNMLEAACMMDEEPPMPR